MDQGINEQFANDSLIEGRHMLTIETIGQLIALSEIRHFSPNSFYQLYWIRVIIGPVPFINLISQLVVLEHLHERRATQFCSISCMP